MSTVLTGIHVIETTISVPRAKRDALRKALEASTTDHSTAPTPCTQSGNLLDHLRVNWGWRAALKNGVLGDFRPVSDSVDTDSMLRLFRLLAPVVRAPSPVPCLFAYCIPQTGDFTRFVLLPGKQSKPETSQLIVQSGHICWRTPGTGRSLSATLAEIASEGVGGGGSSAGPELLLERCLRLAHQFEQGYWEANRKADNEDADLVDTQYMDDELVYPLKKAARLRALALELLLDHQINPVPPRS